MRNDVDIAGEFRDLVSLLDFAARIQAGMWDQHPEMRNGRPRPVPLVLAPILGAFMAAPADFIVGGTVAMVAHGATRGTTTLELVVRSLPDASEASAPLVRALEQVHARRRHETRDRFTYSCDHGFLALYESSIPFDDLLTRAVPTSIPNLGRIWFAGKDDLIAMKRAAGRPQDLLDIERIERGGDPLTGF